MDSPFNVKKFKEQLARIESLIEDYKVIKSDLNYYSNRLENMYSEKSGYPSLETLYDLEDKQFSKCMDAVCVFQDIVVLFSRIEENEQTIFTLKRLEKEIEALDPIEAYFYYDFEPSKGDTEHDS